MSSQILEMRSGAAQKQSKNMLCTGSMISCAPRSKSGCFILSEMRVKQAGVEAEISLKMFHLQRQKQSIVSQHYLCLLLIALEVKLTELEKLPLPFSTSRFIHGYCCALCIDYRLPLFQYCKYIRPPVTAAAQKQPPPHPTSPCSFCASS